MKIGTENQNSGRAGGEKRSFGTGRTILLGLVALGTAYLAINLGGGSQNASESEEQMNRLIKAVSERDSESVWRALSDKDANVNMARKNGVTALMFASSKGWEDMISLLIRLGADLDPVNNEGNTALFYSVLGGAGAAQILLSAGSKVDIANHKGMTALMVAAQQGNAEVAKLLIEAGADINMANDDGLTALMLGVISGRVPVVQLLVENGAVADLKSDEGVTALMYSLDSDSRITKILLDGGASTKVTNKRGKTALELAVETGNNKAEQLLRLARQK